MSRSKLIKVGVSGLIVVGCFLIAGRFTASSSLTQTRPAPSGQPNLLIALLLYQLETGDACLNPSRVGTYGVGVWVSNTGTGDAGEFSVMVNGQAQHITQGLASGETMRLWFPGDHEVNVRVDPSQRVAESDETDNNRQEMLPVPTQPVVCTSTATPIAISADANMILTKASDRLWRPIPNVNVNCQVDGVSLRCALAAGHETTVSIGDIQTPISTSDAHYRGFHDAPMLLWEAESPLVSGGRDRKIIWQIGEWEIHINSFDDTGIEIAFDPLLVAEAIYQAMIDSEG